MCSPLKNTGNTQKNVALSVYMRGVGIQHNRPVFLSGLPAKSRRTRTLGGRRNEVVPPQNLAPYLPGGPSAREAEGQTVCHQEGAVFAVVGDISFLAWSLLVTLALRSVVNPPLRFFSAGGNSMCCLVLKDGELGQIRRKRTAVWFAVVSSVVGL